MHTLGTAGHVDHGKSSLVRALTGTNPDRFAEERARGMTLDLGFARLDLPDGTQAGIIDVPGHERFLHNMLAGAAGVEFALVIVAANDGPRAQTFEHLEILRYLNLRRGLVVLSKADLVPAAERDAVRAQVRARLAGTIVADAQAIFSSAETGEGLDDLRAAIAREMRTLPARTLDAPAYLPIDRAFTLAGRGTVVTGTLGQGRLAVGDRLTVAPGAREVRVRSLHVFGEARERVDAGARVAAALHGVSREEVARGSVLASAELAERARFAVRFRPVPEMLGLLRRRTPVRAHVGAAELIGVLVFGATPVDGRETTAELRLRAPVIAVPGAPFVVRRLSPKTLLGGGTVVALGAPSTADGGDRGEARGAGAALAALAAAGLGGATAAEVATAANLRESRAAGLLAELAARDRAFALARPAAYVDASIATALAERAGERLARAHCEAPWALGMTSLALARALTVPEAALVRGLAPSVERGGLAYRGGYYAAADFTPQVTSEQRAFFERVVPVDRANAFVPVPFASVPAAMKASEILGLAQAFETLQAAGALVRVGEFLYRGAQIAGVRARLEARLGGGGTLTPAEFRDLLGTSRKFAVPLLEWCDAAGITMRTGDVRVLRGYGTRDRAAQPPR